MYYFIRVFNDGDDTEGPNFREYDITTNRGDGTARLFAFLMDGGAGNEFEDDEGIEALALTYTSIVEKRKA